MTDQLRPVTTPAAGRWARFDGRGGLGRVDAALCRIAPALLLLSLLGHFALLVFVPGTANMVDLVVYRDGSAEILTGHLWDYRFGALTDDFPLPFTYPPFAALLMLPLSWIPLVVLKYLWHAGSLLALYFVVRRSMSLIAGRTGNAPGADAVADPLRWHRRAMYWTALAMWLEPVRTTLNYGQVNLLIAAVVLAALTTRSVAGAGLGIGIAAGIKLVPAISGLYFLVTRRWAAAIASGVVFVLTIVLSFAVAPELSHRYWFELLGDASRIGPVASAINQSVRGALSRTVGHDVGTGALWLLVVGLILVLAGLALVAAVRARDVLAMILVVQVVGLLISPVSWSHHWVWIVPALVWTAYGVARHRRLVWLTGVVWAVLAGSYLISWLIAAQPSIWTISRPLLYSVLGWAYPGGGVLLLVAIWLGLRGLRVADRPASVTAAAPHAPADSKTPEISAASVTSSLVIPPAE
jgi:alpha-1,2-mannosyltransferase